MRRTERTNGGVKRRRGGIVFLPTIQMSLLGSQVYANPDTPLWLSNSGGVITGNLTVEGAVYAGTGLVTYAGGGLGGVEILDPADDSQKLRLAVTTGGSPRSIIQSANPIFFNQIGTANGNTSLTLSAFGANADLLSVGGTVSTLKLGMNAAGAAATVGTATIAVGQTNIVVATTAVSASSKIFVSHAGAPSAGPGAGAGQGGLTVGTATIVPGTSFRIDLVDPATGISVAASLVDVPVNWFIIN